MPIQAANSYLQTPEKREALFRQDGFLYFKNVLDLDAISELKRRVFSVLVDKGYAKLEQENPVWTGKPLLGGKAGSPGPELQDAFDRLQLWETFVKEPKIWAFFEHLAGEPIEFIPVAYFRIRLPGDDLIWWHQDGYFNQGAEARTAWIPLMSIDESLGGLQLALGMHDRYWHTALTDIPDNVFPQDCRSRVPNYEPGDVVIFGDYTPHTGLPNTSKQGLLRVSLDVRYVAVSQRSIADGLLREIGRDYFEFVRGTGEIIKLRVDKDSIVRGRDGAVVAGNDLTKWTLQIGDRVISTMRDGIAKFVRPVISKDASRRIGEH